MPNVLRIAVVDPKDSSRDALKSMLLGLDTVWLEAECSRYEFFADVVAQTNPDVGFVALDSNPDKALELVESLAKSAPKCDILVTSTSTDGNLILRAMRAGAKEFLTQPLKPKTWPPRCSASPGNAAAAPAMPAGPARSSPSPAPPAASAPRAWP